MDNSPITVKYLEDLQLLNNEEIAEKKITIKGMSEAGDGYSGFIIFANVSGVRNGDKVSLDLAIKHCSLREDRLNLLTTVFQVETYIYETVVPTFQQYLAQFNVKLDFFSKYYHSIMESSPPREILIMEDLKKKGFAVHNLHQCFNLESIKRVLGKYAQWHSASYCYAHEYPEKFRKLAQPLKEMRLSVEDGLVQFFEAFYDTFKNVLNHYNETEILEKVEKFTLRDLFKMNDMDAASAILHGDCWNNNIMLKYKEQNLKAPDEIKIIDWQIARPGNPIFDVAYFLFCHISSEDLPQVPALLDHYYETFAQCVKAVGKQPEQVYSRATFDSDWKKYAKISMIHCPVLYFMAAKPPTDKKKQTGEVELTKDTFKFNAEDCPAAAERTRIFAHYINDNKLI